VAGELHRDGSRHARTLEVPNGRAAEVVQTGSDEAWPNHEQQLLG
jgi:hypothetical protein